MKKKKTIGLIIAIIVSGLLLAVTIPTGAKCRQINLTREW